MEPILRAVPTADWMTMLIFGSLLFLVIAKGLFYTRFMNFIILPFNNKYIFMYNKKEKLLNWFHIFFTIFMISNFSLFVFLSWRTFFQPEYTSYPFIFPIILGGLLLFLLVKIFLQLGNGFIFNANKVISDLIFKKLSYLNHSGIIMLLANIILCYIAKDSKIVIYTSASLIILINGIGWVTTVKNHQKFITNNFFYFILYLCALEIAPFIIVASYLTD
tara:strand:- start:33006 stop:33662 length:657 start_codon:yes stop_codon:yes gene_type:complete